MNLTVKQENFCNYYIETGNASEAYRRSYNTDSMKVETVNRNANELLKNNKITTRVQQLQKSLQNRSDITKNEAVKELTNIVRSRITNVLNAKGMRVTVKSLDDLPDEVVACVSSVKKVRGGIEIKFYDKISAIDRLSKMLGWDVPEVKDVKITSQFDTWSDEEIREFLKETAEVLKTK